MSSSDARPLHDLSSFQRDCLATIGQLDAPCGLDIKDRLQQSYDGKVRHGRLYSNLDTLVDMGLIEKGKIDDRTNSYELTPRGRREMSAHVAWLRGDN